MSDLTTTSVEVVKVMIGVRDSIRTLSERERDKGGYEAVGLLGGAPGDKRIGIVLPLNNHAADPQTAFFVEPWEQFKAETALADAGLELRGVYHSHPASEAVLSTSDEQFARPGELIFLYSPLFEELNAWREKDGELLRVQLEFVDPDDD